MAAGREQKRVRMSPLSETYGLWTVEARFLCTSAGMGATRVGAPVSEHRGRDRGLLQKRQRKRERIRRVDRRNAGEPQHDANHLSDLCLFRAAAAGNHALDQGRRVFMHCEAGPRANEQGDAASVAEFRGRLRIPGIKERFDAGHEGGVCPDDLIERALDGHEAHPDGCPFVRVDDPVVSMDEASATPLDDAPSKMSRPWVDAENDHVA
jgi:hypothetical protein